MAATPPTLIPDTPAANFRLPGTDGRTYTLDDVAGKNGTVIVFICNHCPYVKAVIDRLVADAQTLIAEGIGFAAICSNDADAYPAELVRRDAALRAGTYISVPLSARRGPVGRAGLRRRLHARLLRLRREPLAQIPWSPRRGPHQPATSRRAPGVGRGHACHCGDRHGAARPGAVDRLFDQVEGRRVREVAMRCGPPPGLLPSRTLDQICYQE